MSKPPRFPKGGCVKARRESKAAQSSVRGPEGLDVKSFKRKLKIQNFDADWLVQLNNSIHSLEKYDASLGKHPVIRACLKARDHKTPVDELEALSRHACWVVRL